MASADESSPDAMGHNRPTNDCSPDAMGHNGPTDDCSPDAMGHNGPIDASFSTLVRFSFAVPR